MPKFFMRADGLYLETLVDVQSWPDDWTPIAQRPADHWNWTGAAWEEGEMPPAEPAVLDPAQFEFLLALTGFGDVWDGLEAAAKAAGQMPQYAALKAERKRRTFRLDRTLAVVAQFRATAAQIAPDVDLTETAIRSAWAQAAAWKGL